MVSVMLLTCAQDVIIDRQTNSVSIIKLVEELNPPTFPALFAPFVILGIFEREQTDPQEVETLIRLTLSEETLIEQTLPINFRDRKRHRNILQLSGVPLSGPGTLRVSAYSGDNPLGEYTIEVTTSESQIQVINQPNQDE